MPRSQGAECRPICLRCFPSLGLAYSLPNRRQDEAVERAGNEADSHSLAAIVQSLGFFEPYPVLGVIMERVQVQHVSIARPERGMVRISKGHVGAKGISDCVAELVERKSPGSDVARQQAQV